MRWQFFHSAMSTVSQKQIFALEKGKRREKGGFFLLLFLKQEAKKERSRSQNNTAGIPKSGKKSSN